MRHSLSRLPYVTATCIVIAASTAHADPSLERGTYLAEGVVACGNCHLARDADGAPQFDLGLAGGMLFTDGPFRSYAANITPDPETGVGSWTREQLAIAIREGRRPDGTLIGPPMPIEFYRVMSDDDLESIVDYLLAQPAAAHDVPASAFDMPLPPDYGPPVGELATPSTENPVRYGEYLVGIGHCMECHTLRDEKGGFREDLVGAGGRTFKGPWGESVSRNLTPHETGLGGWSDAQIATAIRTGTDRDGNRYDPPMAFAFYEHIDDADIAAIIAYLRTLEPIEFAGAR